MKLPTIIRLDYFHFFPFFFIYFEAIINTHSKHI